MRTPALPGSARTTTRVAIFMGLMGALSFTPAAAFAASATADIIQLTVTFTLNGTEGLDPFESQAGWSTTTGLGSLGERSFSLLDTDHPNCTIDVCVGPNLFDPEGNYHAIAMVGPTTATAIPPPVFSQYSNVLVGLITFYNFATTPQTITFQWNLAYSLSAIGSTSSAGVSFLEDLNPIFSDSIVNDNLKVDAKSGTFQVGIDPGVLQVQDGNVVLVPGMHQLNLQAVTMAAAVVPEPPVLWLLTVGFLATVALRYRGPDGQSRRRCRR